MLGLGHNITRSRVPLLGSITPADLSGLSLWMDANDTTTLNAKLAASFNSVSNEYLSSNDSIFNVGNEDFSVGGWVKLNSTTTQVILSKWVTNFNNRSYIVYVNASNTVLVELSSDGVSSSLFTTTFTLTTGVWKFLVVSYDSVNDLIKVSVDGATFQTQSNSTGAFSSAVAPFVFGAYNSTSLPLNGIIDSAFFYKKALSQSQVTALYNSGNGVAYENLSVDQLTNLTEWWKLNERSGVRVGVHNGYNLTDNNTVTYAIGHVKEPITADDYIFSIIDKSPNLYEFSQDTAASQPQWKENGFGTNNMPCISFNGTTDSLRLIVSDIFNTHTQGTIFIVYQCTDIANPRYSILSSCDTIGANNKIAFYHNGQSSGYANYPAVIANNAGDIDSVSGNLLSITEPSSGITQTCVLVIQSNSLSYIIKINNVTQEIVVLNGSNSGTWFSDITGRDNLVIGAEVDNAPTYFPMKLGEIVYTNQVLSGGYLKRMNNYFVNKYGAFSNNWKNEYSFYNSYLGATPLQIASGYTFIGYEKQWSTSFWINIQSDIHQQADGMTILSDSSFSIAYYSPNADGVFNLYAIFTDGINYSDLWTIDTVNVGQWYHVVFTNDGTGTLSGIKFYLNGVLCSNNNNNDNCGAVTASNVNIFSDAVNAYSFSSSFSIINNLLFFSSELNQATVTSIYNSGVPKNEITLPNLVSMYQMGNNATVVGSNVLLPEYVGNKLMITASQSSSVNIISEIPTTAWSNTKSLDFSSYTTANTLSSTNSKLTSTINIDTAFSVSCWIKITSFALDSTIFEFSDALSVAYQLTSQIDTFGKIAIYAWDGTSSTPQWDVITDNSVLTINTWHHVVITFSDTNTVNIYVDGVSKAITVNTSPSPVSIPVSEELYLCCNNPTAVFFSIATLQGKINEFYIFQEELSPSEVTGIYNSGVPKQEFGYSQYINFSRYKQIGGTLRILPDMSSTTVSSSAIVTDIPS